MFPWRPKHRAILSRESRGLFFTGFRTRLRLRDSRETTRPGAKATRSPAREPQPSVGLKLYPVESVGVAYGRRSMPYALFSNDAKLSKAYPTEAEVWKLARQSGLVVDVTTDDGRRQGGAATGAGQ